MPPRLRGKAETQATQTGNRMLRIPFLGILLLGLLVAGGLKGWQVYKQAMLVAQDATQIRAMLNGPGSKLEQVKSAGPALTTCGMTLKPSKSKPEPFLGLGRGLKWVPKYGGDLASVQDLMNMAEALLTCANTTYQAAMPLLGGIPRRSKPNPFDRSAGAGPAAVDRSGSGSWAWRSWPAVTWPWLA